MAAVVWTCMGQTMTLPRGVDAAKYNGLEVRHAQFQAQVDHPTLNPCLDATQSQTYSQPSGGQWVCVEDVSTSAAEASGMFLLGDAAASAPLYTEAEDEAAAEASSGELDDGADRAARMTTSGERNPAGPRSSHKRRASGADKRRRKAAEKPAAPAKTKAAPPEQLQASLGLRSKQLHVQDGFVTKTHGAHRAEGGGAVTGKRRTCVIDSCLALLGFDSRNDAGEVARIKAMLPDTDASYEQVSEVLERELGWKISPVTAQLMETPGVRLNVLRSRNCPLLLALGLRYKTKKRTADPEPDGHCVAYNGDCIIDNTGGVTVVEESDRATKASALALFDSLYPRLVVNVKSVYELIAVAKER
jgi:hypothetical protein